MQEELKIKGVHHISIKAQGLEQMEKTVEFYRQVLGLKVVRRWGQGDSSACMVDAGGCLLEIMASGQTGDTGVVNHFALAVEPRQLDQWVAKVRAAGCPITMEPQDKILPAQPPFPVRIAFFQGPAGELVELMAEKE